MQTTGLNHMAYDDIRDKELALVMWDWAPFRQCFEGTNICLSDLDGAVERNGHILIIETKYPNTPVPRGQAIMFRALAEKPGVTVMIVWGKKNEPERLQYVGDSHIYEVDLVDMMAHVHDWFMKANEAGPPVVSDEQGWRWLKSLSPERFQKLVHWGVRRLTGTEE